MIVGRQFRQARDRFVELLENPDSLEREWESLFTDFPFILTECLALGIEPTELIPCRPGKAEADFYFYPSAENPLSRFGVIEIKRPKTTILKTPRKNLILLSSDAATAVAQAQKYAIELGTKIPKIDEQWVVLGNPCHIIVIAGMSTEIARKVTTELHSTQVSKLLPSNCRFLPFDKLSESLASRTPPIVHVVSTWSRVINLIPSEASRIRRFSRFGPPRQMYPTTCTDCGIKTEVPFIPREGKRVYCRECFRKRRSF